jgi:hypothetical protein
MASGLPAHAGTSDALACFTGARCICLKQIVSQWALRSHDTVQYLAVEQLTALMLSQCQAPDSFKYSESLGVRTNLLYYDYSLENTQTQKSAVGSPLKRHF